MIPQGCVTTYGEIARHLGSPGASRAVGTALRKNPTPGIIPCHRVVRADLSVGKFLGLSDPRKRELLVAEGVTFLSETKIHRRHLYLFD